MICYVVQFYSSRLRESLYALIAQDSLLVKNIAYFNLIQIYLCRLESDVNISVMFNG